MNPKYPVYIISKGRWESRLTAKAFERMRVPYRIVIEPQELKQYASVIDREKIIVLPFSNLGQGSIPARNFVWEHALNVEKSDRHWILDDNISGFMRLNRNLKIRVGSGTIFRVAEKFVDRYSNVAIAGFNYDFFAKRKQKIPPFYTNTRIYSCILLDNHGPFRWRGKYNEDTDLSLRLLKQGFCSVLFNAFLACKAATMTMKGGNTDCVYIDGDKRKKFAKSLKEQHPDCVEVKWKFGRWHHQVDYSPFASNKLQRKEDAEFEQGINEHGLCIIKNGKHVDKEVVLQQKEAVSFKIPEETAAQLIEELPSSAAVKEVAEKFQKTVFKVDADPEDPQVDEFEDVRKIFRQDGTKQRSLF